MNDNDYVLLQNNKDGKYSSLGYSIDSTLLNNDNSDNLKGGGLGLLNNLAVPAGLFMINKSVQNNKYNINNILDNNILSESLHDRLLKLVSNEKSKVNIKTKKIYNKKKGNKTRRK